jgi:tRNA(adenine34) deaminase
MLTGDRLILSQEQDERWMQYALDLADRAQLQGEIPVGAVLIKDDKIIGQGWNLCINGHDPSAHAEMVAISQAGQVTKNYRLVDTTLYVTLEPCPMCAGLLVHSRVARLVFGASDFKSGAGGSVMDLMRDSRLNHQLQVDGGVLAKQCAEKLSSFFKERRAQKKRAKKQQNQDRD